MPNHIEYPVFRDHYGIFPLNKLASFAAEKYGNRVFIRTWNGDSYDEVTFDAFSHEVDTCASSIIAEGLKKGDKIAILADDGLRWGLAYLAIHGAGAVVVPIDRLMTAEQMRHVLNDSDAKLLFTSSKYLEMLGEGIFQNKGITIISFDMTDIPDSVLFENILKMEKKDSTTLPEINLDDLAAILYTSGTTGASKGVMLTHRNIMSNVAATMQMTTLGVDDIFLSLMPMHHAYQCTNGFLHPLYIGSSITYARRLRSKEIIQDILESQVTVMGAVPLLFEKIRAGITRKAKEKGKIALFLFNLLMALSAFGEKIGLNLGYFLFKGLRNKAGMGTLKYFITGGAAIDPTTSMFFNRFGIKMLQGFGITEASPLTHFTPPTKIIHQCVGLPVPELKCKIDEPNEEGVGELLIKGPNIFKGYYKNETATKEAFTDDGWFITGDMGIIHKNGYLQITGRKKNLIVTAGGKNIYPEEIEFFLLKSPFIEECIVLGIKDKGEYFEEPGALIKLDEEAVASHYHQGYEKVDKNTLKELIRLELKKAMGDLPPHKQIKKFKIIKDELEKTSTRKVKRFLYKGYLDTEKP